MKIFEITVSSEDRLPQAIRDRGIRDEDIINIQYISTHYTPVERGFKVEKRFYVFVRE